MLCQMIYSSQALQPMGSPELAQILADARGGNEARDVTGVLVYADGVFLQVLEGERAALDELIESIRSDKRHHSMKVFRDEPIDERAFSDWRMAYLAPNAGELANWVGLAGSDTVDGVLARVHSEPAHVPRILTHILEAIAAVPGLR